MIEETEWNLPVSASGKDYKTSLYNKEEAGIYPSTSTDGVVTAYVGLPQYGEIYSGNDLGNNYWHINRFKLAIDLISAVTKLGYEVNNIIANYYSLRPVIVLKSNVKINNGEGTISNPYSLSL